MVTLFDNTEVQQCHGMVANYRGKKFYNISPWCQFNLTIWAQIYSHFLINQSNICCIAMKISSLQKIAKKVL
jgi:hypothetical protein